MKVHITEDDVPNIKTPNFLGSFNNFFNYTKILISGFSIQKKEKL